MIHFLKLKYQHLLPLTSGTHVYAAARFITGLPVVNLKCETHYLSQGWPSQFCTSLLELSYYISCDLVATFTIVLNIAPLPMITVHCSNVEKLLKYNRKQLILLRIYAPSETCLNVVV